ncbi:MAG: glycoside hydrolase family 92 protein [Deltaproteobacteria bacterium]|nr:glycoside hydrolase family 92 protein [Deltaproteobacteria bacterium]
MTNPMHWVLVLLIAVAMTATAVNCGGGDDDDDDVVDDDTVDDDDDTVDDDTSDDDTADDDTMDDDTMDDDTSDDDTVDDDDDDDTFEPVDNAIPYVDPMIGTGGLIYGMGALNPGPMLPNAPMKLGPDTSIGDLVIDKTHAGGYYWYDSTIRGFSHTHLPSTGITDLGHIGLMPVLGISDAQIAPKGFWSDYQHENEQARVGYYSVVLDNGGIQVELTSTLWSGIHRYTFPATAAADEPHVIVDVSYANAQEQVASVDSDVTIDPEAKEVYGSNNMNNGGFSGRTGGLRIYFVVRFDTAFADYGTYKNGVRTPSGTSESGVHSGAYVGFAGGTSQVVAKIGMSIISVDQARANLAAEIGSKSFEDVVEDAEDAWAPYLDDVTVYGGSDLERTLFYTALFHLYVLPTNFTETNGKYVGFDRAAHDADGFTYYTDFSLWDTFRTLHPLITLLRPDLARDFVDSLITMYEQGGAFPRWAALLGDGGSMIGTHSDSVVVDTYVKGVTDFDVDTAYEGLYAHATGPVPYGGRPGLDQWIDQGYLDDSQSGSVSKTQEYAYNDFCLSVFADALGEDSDAAMFGARAKNYANLWDPEKDFFRAREEGTGDFYDKFNEWWLNFDEYTEGNARHWRWYAPHDPVGLISLFDDKAQFISELTEFFENIKEDYSGLLPDPYYYHGNEPDIHTPYLFAIAGRPDLTAKWVRWVMTYRYDDTPDGIFGNDDGGTLSAWYVFSALGFYPVSVCTDVYVIGSPSFPKADVSVGENTLTVIAKNASPTNIYVQSAKLNGAELTKPWFHHGDIADGGTLEFVMGDTPSSWGQGATYDGHVVP